MSHARLIALVTLSMLAFAGNSLLCRLALRQTAIDPASFTTIRLASGAFVLWLIASLQRNARGGGGNWLSALALFVYAAGFSFAYVSLTAATGALLLFGAVQVTMIGYGIAVGERLRRGQIAGLLLAMGGLLGLLFPGWSAPPLRASLLMLSAGMTWGIYSLRGKGAADPTRVTAGNFLRTLPIAALLSLLMLDQVSLDGGGVAYAVLSGALASGIGYSIWYAALPRLKAASAASVQLSVPVLTAMGGILLLDEVLSLRLVLASIAVLGGITLVLFEKPLAQAAT